MNGHESHWVAPVAASAGVAAAQHPEDPAQARTPKTMCIGCGLVSATTHDYLVHVSYCPEPRTRPLVCPECLYETWRRATCRGCGRELTR